MHDRGGVGHLLDPERAPRGRGEELARGLRLHADVGRDEREAPVGGDAQRDDVGRPQRQHAAVEQLVGALLVERQIVVDLADAPARHVFSRRVLVIGDHLVE